MRVVLSSTSGVPIYEQIERQVIDAILAGILAEGEALPSLRVLAKDLRVSLITTTRAYSELAAQGFITHVPGKGSYVLPQSPTQARERYAGEIAEHLATVAALAHRARMSRDDLIVALDSALQENS